MSVRVFVEPEKIRNVAGEPLRGEVIVEVDAACRCKNLSVKLFWQAGEGRLVRDTGGLLARRLHKGSWKPGRHAFRFEFPTPFDGPWVYDGRKFSLEWIVEAHADLERGEDVTTRRAVMLSPPPLRLDPGPFCSPEPRIAPAYDGDPPWLLRGLAIFCAALVVGFVVDLVWFRGKGGFCLGLPVAGLVAWATGKEWLRQRSQTVMGVEAFSVQPLTTHAGGAVTVHLRLRPRRDLKVRSIRVMLRRFEQFRVPEGRRRIQMRKGAPQVRQYVTKREQVFELAEEVKKGGWIGAGEPYELTHTLTVPADAGYSFTAKNNSVVWAAGVDFALDKTGWSRWQPIRLVPASPPPPSVEQPG